MSKILTITTLADCCWYSILERQHSRSRADGSRCKAAPVVIVPLAPALRTAAVSRETCNTAALQIAKSPSNEAPRSRAHTCAALLEIKHRRPLLHCAIYIA